MLICLKTSKERAKVTVHACPNFFLLQYSAATSMWGHLMVEIVTTYLDNNV